VKYERLQDSFNAYQHLKSKYDITFISTLHSSDEAAYYRNKASGIHNIEEDAYLTLNMFNLRGHNLQNSSHISSQS